jgi:hypothetical protein
LDQSVLSAVPVKLLIMARRVSGSALAYIDENIFCSAASPPAFYTDTDD